MALMWGAPPVQDRPPPTRHYPRVLTLPRDDAAAEHALNELLTAAHGAGYDLNLMAAVGRNRLVLTFSEPRAVWRASEPGEPLYEHTAGAAHDGAAYLANLVTVSLPEKDPTLPPDEDDPDYEPMEVAPTDAEVNDLVAKTSMGSEPDDDEESPTRPVMPPIETDEYQ